jgi:hypothetical protein
MPSALQDWVQKLSIMQQSVLMSAVRNEDQLPKGHPQKDLIRWYRRCVLVSAFDGAAITDPYSPGGGSFTGPLTGTLEEAQDAFLRSRDGMSLHYYAHAMHAFEILGYHHPDPNIRLGWRETYYRLVEALHVWPETPQQLDDRLSDNPELWKAREDKAGGCTT